MTAQSALAPDGTAQRSDAEKLLRSLTDLAKQAQQERPRDRADGRCLGDFVDFKKYPFGLAISELSLLAVAPRGTHHAVSTLDWREEQDLKKLKTNPEWHVRASFLRFLVLGGDSFVPVHERGIEIGGAFIDGEINLVGGKSAGKLALIGCYIDGRLNIEGATLGSLFLSGSRVAGIHANRSKIEGSVLLEDDFVSDGGISFYRAEVTGSVQCNGHLNGDGEGRALACSLATIRGDVTLGTGFHSKGCVFLNAAHIGGSLECSGGIFENPEQTAIRAGNIRVERNVTLGRDFAAKGCVWLLGARIGGDLDCSGGTFDNPGKIAIEVGDINVDINALLRNGFKSNGGVRLLGARIGGDLDCSGGKFSNPEGTAILCDRARIGGNVLMGTYSEPSFQALGCVSFSGAEIGGRLDCRGGAFKGSESRDKGAIIIGMALDCSNATIKRGVICGANQSGQRFEAEGLVSLVGANVEGQLDCSGGVFRGLESIDAKGVRRFGTALNCSNVRLKMGAFLNQIWVGLVPSHRFEAEGTVWFSGANIEGQLYCSGGSFKAPESVDDKGVRHTGYALNCDTARIKDIALAYTEGERGELGQRFEAEGEVSLQGIQVDVHLDCMGGKFNNPEGTALTCQAANIGGCVFLRKNYSGQAPPGRPTFESFGKVVFTATTVGRQFDCQGGRFENREVEQSDEGFAAVALDLSMVTIKDTLLLGAAEPSGSKRAPAAPEATRREPATVNGSLSLLGATTRVLVDYGLLGSGKAGDKGLAKSVKCSDGKNRTCHLGLDGFTYERIEGSASCKAGLRQQWLARQPPKHLKGDFRPQPFEQLVKVLRAMGHGHDADVIAISKRRYLRRARPWRRVHMWLPELLFLDGFLGYGYRLMRALALLVLIGVVYALFYDQQAKQGMIVPAKADILKDKRFEKCHPPVGNWVYCRDLEKAYVPFNPWLYSANMMLPVIEFGQRSAWEPAHVRTSVLELPMFGKVPLPSNSFVYYMQCLEIGIGWLCGILLGAVFGLVKRE